MDDGSLIAQVQLYPLEGADQQPGCVVEIGTRAGLKGLGEVAGDPPDQIAGVRSEWEPALVGKDSAAIARLCSGLRTHRGLSDAVVGAIEMALWDLHGKRLHAPVHQFFGGPVRDRIRVCARVTAWTLPELVTEAAAAAAAGVSALSWCPSSAGAGGARFDALTHIANAVEALRGTIGTTMDLAVDLRHFSVPLEPAWLQGLPVSLLLNPWPTASASPRVIAEGTRGLPMPVGMAVGNDQNSTALLRDQAIGVAVVDPVQAGGIIATRQIFSAAEVYFVSGILSTRGGRLETLASVHLAACVPNLIHVELPLRWCAKDECLPQPLAWDAPGYLQVPAGDGWGAGSDWHSWHKAGSGEGL